jgi:hypothetical protein
MENQTRFDLNAAVENWRNELAAQPNLASDDRRELETHLRDAIAGFQQRGLNDEESFVLARHRVGQMQPLDHEFIKNKFIQPWFINRMLVILSVTSLFLWLLTATVFPDLNERHILSNHPNFGIWNGFSNWLSYWGNFVNECFLLNVILIALFCLLTFRRRFVVIAAALFFTVRILQAIVYTQGTERMKQFAISRGGIGTLANEKGIVIHPNFMQWNWMQNFWHTFTSMSSISESMWFVILAMLIASLMPTQNRKTPKRA